MTAAPAAEAVHASTGIDAPELLRPGETCWRIETARRLAFLIDAQAYYAALLEALGKARQSIWMKGLPGAVPAACSSSAASS